jgi:hypothetical protein
MVSVLTRHGISSPYRRDFLPDGREVVRKNVKPHHELTTPPGVAVDETVIQAAEVSGCAGIAIHRARTGQTLWAPMARWQRGIPISRGFGPQRALRWCDLEPLHGGRSQQVPLFATVAAP